MLGLVLQEIGVLLLKLGQLATLEALEVRERSLELTLLIRFALFGHLFLSDVVLHRLEQALLVR